MTTVANPTLGKIEDVFKIVVWDVLVDASLGALFAAEPWLATWPLGPMLRGFVHLFSDKLYLGARLLLDLQAIMITNELHKRYFNSSAATLKIIAHDKGIDSPEFKEATLNAKKDFAKFVHFNGA